MWSDMGSAVLVVFLNNILEPDCTRWNAASEQCLLLGRLAMDASKHNPGHIATHPMVSCCCLAYSPKH
jgi:hypothetical protein